MKARLMTGVALATLLLAGLPTVAGTSYSDAININLSAQGSEANCDVTAPLATPYYASAIWYNYRINNYEINRNNYNQDIYSRSPAETLTARGHNITNVGLSFYTDNMYSHGFPVVSVNGGQPANSLSRSGFWASCPYCSGPNRFYVGATSGGYKIPASFTNAGYDVALMDENGAWSLYDNGGAHYVSDNDGGCSRLFSTASDGQGWAAIQILKVGPPGGTLLIVR